MRKTWASLLCAAGLVCLGYAPAQAVEIKLSGAMEFTFQSDAGVDQSTVGAFQDYADTVWNGVVPNGDKIPAGYPRRPGIHNKHFRANQRLIMRGDFIISENLSAVYDCIAGFFTWGGPATGVTPYPQMNGGALGTRAGNIITRNAYLDWTIPHTRIKIRMGQQFFYLPGFATGTLPIKPEWGTGIVVNAPLTDRISATAMWQRATSGPRRGVHPNFSTSDHLDDTSDFFALSVPVRGTGFRLAPHFGLGIVGKDSFTTKIQYKSGFTYNPAANYHTPANFYALRDSFGLDPQGMFEHGASATSDWGLMPVTSASAIANLQNHTEYQAGNLHPWWIGFGGEITRWDPLRLGFDLAYSASKTDHKMFDRAGWYASFAASYKTRYGVPAIKAWWTSGDDGNIQNGSERPVAWAMTGANTGLLNASGYGNITLGFELGTLVGTRGFSLQWNSVSFVEKLFHNFRIAYFNGTNNAAMAPYARMGLHRKTDSPGNVINYLTTKDRMVEFDWENIYSIYKNLAAMLEFSYILTDFDGKAWGTWVNVNGRNEWHDAKFTNAWRVALSFRYLF